MQLTSCPDPGFALTPHFSPLTYRCSLLVNQVQPLSPRTWLLAPVVEAAQPAVSLTLLDMGRPVVCAIALPNLPRNSMGGEKLLRMMVSYDGQSRLGRKWPPWQCRLGSPGPLGRSH